MSISYVGKTRSGKIVTIWNDGTRIWRWSAAYEDGSGRQFDWGTSYSSVRKQIPVIIGKMKKQKHHE